MTLPDLASELFVFLSVFRRKVAERIPMSVDSVANDLEMIFARMDRAAAEDPVLEKRYKESNRLTLAIIADGIISGSTWDKALDYRSSHLLENKYYRTNKGGDRFFDEISAIADDEAREIYFTALALGFQGRLARQPEARAELKKKLYLGLPKKIVSPTEKITPQAYESTDSRDCTVPPLRRLSRYAVILVGILLFILALEQIVYRHQTESIRSDANILKGAPVEKAGR